MNAAKNFEEPRPGAWYFSLQNDPPFLLEGKVGSRDPSSSHPFCAVSVFPWDESSLETLWHGEFISEPRKSDLWREVCSRWSGMVAAGGGSELRLFLTRPAQKYLHVCTIDVPRMDLLRGNPKFPEEAEVASVAWCMVQDADGFWPLVAFSANSVIYIYNVRKHVYHGVLRGHGGKITSLAAHPKDPSILASTSHDLTCRIYDLTKRVECRPNNPRWAGPESKVAQGGPQFGLRSVIPEGRGYGRCTAVLCGSPSNYGGHQNPVLSAAFHPSYPIIATCGMDRAVKLWRLPLSSDDKLIRDDKPLFSNTDIHDAQVLSVAWLGKDILLTICGEVLEIIREKLGTPSEKSFLATSCVAPGTVVLWQWLSLDRYFPPDCGSWSSTVRGCASDFQGSSSYKIISRYQLPQPQLAILCNSNMRGCVFETPKHTPLIAFPSYGCIYLSSVHHFEPRSSYYLRKLEPLEDDLTAATKQLSLEASDTRAMLPYWIVETGNHDKTDDPPKLEACAIGENGRLLIGVGENKGIWIWRIPSVEQARRDPSHN